MNPSDLYARLRETVLAALTHIIPDLPADIAARVEVTPTRDPAHGDMATNAAMVSAKAARQPPAKIAAALVQHLSAAPDIASAEAAGPGFVNLRLHPETFRTLLPVILTQGESYGDATIGTGIKINVEYVSANPTGPMHIGHCRGAVVGDALANLLAKAGYTVTKEYYINDAGAQVTALAWAAYWRYLQAIDTPLTEETFAAEVPGGLQYKGEYLIEVGNTLAAKYQTTLATPDRGIAAPDLWLDTVKTLTIDAMMTEIRADLGRLGVEQDIYSSERALVASGAADKIINQLQTDGLIYEGVLEPPKGKTPDDWEPRPQTLFRSTRFGDDVDRPLRKSDGSNTYFANDIAYHADKITRGYDVLIDILGADHGGYVPRMKAAVNALS
ncbi:MAG TPA: arginine--tRNA ligase, partial [Rhodopila sp.]